MASDARDIGRPQFIAIDENAEPNRVLATENHSSPLALSWCRIRDDVFQFHPIGKLSEDSRLNSI